MDKRKHEPNRSRNTPNRTMLGKRLRDTRRYLGLTQREAATILRIPRWVLSQIENGIREVDTSVLKRIADIYKQPVDYFTGKLEVADKLSINESYLEQIVSNLPEQDRNELKLFVDYLHMRPKCRGSKRVIYGDTISDAKQEAIQLHNDFNMRTQIEKSGGRIDVFGTFVHTGAPLLFKPLNSLLGVYIEEPIPGVMITTEHSLNVQRFTCAYELGHLKFGHNTSFDDFSILHSKPSIENGGNMREKQIANHFALEFMMPPWLFNTQFEKQSWDRSAMNDPATVYQLSLRIGASYEATCHSLMRPNVRAIESNLVDKLLKVKLKEIKKYLLGDYQPTSWKHDVWVLTAKDEGMVIEGSQSDLFIIKLKENSSAGYIWNFDQLKESGFVILRDELKETESEKIGGSVERCVTTTLKKRKHGYIVIYEHRPWLTNEKPLTTYCFHYDRTCPETNGLSIAEKRTLGATLS